MTAKQLKKLRRKLPYQYAEELAKRTGENISPSLAIAVMNGLRKDYHGIVDTAIEWAKEIEDLKQKQWEEVKVI